MSLTGSRVLQGIGVSPGIAIGKVCIINRGPVRVPRYHVDTVDIDNEIMRLTAAITQAEEQLEKVRQRFASSGVVHQSILEAHVMMVRDPALLSESKGLIQTEGINAEWAISKVIMRLRSLFSTVSDTYIKERSDDIDSIGERILRILTGSHSELSEDLNLSEQSVVLARDLSPVDTALLSRQNIAAFVTEMGGKTSHTSILARSLEVPAVVGASGIVDAAIHHDTIVVDGIDGTVMLRPSRQQMARGLRRLEIFRQYSLELLEARALPAQTLDGTTIQIGGNIERVSEVAQVLSRGGEGIGLYRTEFLVLSQKSLPSEEAHFSDYLALLQALQGKPCTLRTLDLGGDKALPTYPHSYHEPNPALGLRAIRLCLKEQGMFSVQVAGILRAALHGPMRILLPMISNLAELRLAKTFIADVSAKLKQQGIHYSENVPIGIMIEVPSAAMIADLLASECDFISIGTNDLLQYMLAIDRCNDQVAYLYNPLHPAVLRTLKMIQIHAAQHHCPTTLCGEMAGDNDMIPILLGLGFKHLSMNAGSIPAAKRMVRAVDLKDCTELVDQALQCETAEDVAVLLQEFLATKLSDIRRIHGF